MSDSLPLNPPDPRELPAPHGENFRRRVRAHSLLELCEEVDSERRAEIAREILVLGPAALPALNGAASGPRENTAALARSLVRLLLPEEIGREICIGMARQRANYAVEDGAVLLARLGYPNLVAKHVLRDIDRLGGQAQEFVCSQLNITENNVKDAAKERTVEVIKGLSAFWRDEGFHGNAENYYSDKNSYINDVLERRTGLPIALSVVYLALARRMHLKADGVGMPGHFIVRICVESKEGEQYVLLDPFNGARPLDIDDCRKRVEAAGHPFIADEHLKATPPREILTRMCNNLLALFDHQKKPIDSERIATVLVHLQPTDPVPVLIRAERRLRRGERRLARADFMHAKELDPEGPIGRAADELLRRMEYEDPFK